MHALVDVHVPSLFSMRQIMANSLAARTLFCPTPASLKIALLSTLIWRDSDALAEEHLRWLAPLGVAWRAPRRAALSAVTVRALKGERSNPEIKSTVGLREYLSFSEPFGLALIDVPGTRHDDAAYGLTRLTSLGTRDSLVQILRPPVWVTELPKDFTPLTSDVGGPGEVTMLIDDLGPSPAFARISAYREPGRATVQRLGEDRRRLLVTLPYRWRRRTSDGAELETLEP